MRAGVNEYWSDGVMAVSRQIRELDVWNKRIEKQSVQSLANIFATKHGELLPSMNRLMLPNQTNLGRGELIWKQRECYMNWDLLWPFLRCSPLLNY